MQVRIEQRDNVTTACLGRHAESGAYLDIEAVRDLAEALHDGTRTECRLFVLRGSGDAFCDGLDLRDASAWTEDERHDQLRAYAALLSRLAHAPMPTLCLLDAPARGGGVALAAATDVIVATKRASFSLPEISLGIVPGLVLATLLRRLPAQKAARLVLEAEGIDAPSALQLGLIDELVDDLDGLEQSCRRRRRHALRLEPGAVSATKAHLRAVTGLSFEAALDVAVERAGADLARPEITAGIRAILDGERPAWWHSRTEEDSA